MRALQTASRRHRWLATSLLSACLAVAQAGHAQTTTTTEPTEPPGASAPTLPESHGLRLSGFGSAGVTRTSAPPKWGFQRENAQPANDGGTRFDTDSRLGLQANYSVDPRFELIGQLLLMRRLTEATTGDALAWAFAAYHPTADLTLRAGRVNVNLYQLSDYRSVGLAYPFVRPPVEFYNVLTGAVDGVDATQAWHDGSDAVWKLSGFYGRSKQGDTRTSTFRKLQPLWGLFLSHENPGLLLKASYSRAQLAGATPGGAPEIAALLPLASLPLPDVASDAQALAQRFMPGLMVDYIGLGLNYDRDDWLVMVEANRADLRGVVTLQAGYALLGHRFGSFTPYGVLSAARTRASRARPQWAGPLTPLLGPDVAAQAQRLGQAIYDATTVGPGQRTLSLGMRWDLSAQTALKFQYDHSRIAARGGLLWWNSTDEPARAHVLSATFDFVF